MVNIKDNYELYDDYNLSLQYAKNLIPSKVDSKMVIHFYWRVPLEFGRKQVLPIKSALVNNYDLNRDNLEINLWSNIDLSDNSYLSPIKDFINIKVWNPLEEIKGTFLEKHIDYYIDNIKFDNRNWIAGDFFRLLCLYKYGGFYFDMDVLILRDLSPLNKYEFLYQWGSSGTTIQEPNIFYNGAIMRLNKGSSASSKLLEQTLLIESKIESTNWSSTIYTNVEDDNLYHFPCAWFNTEWCLKDPNYIMIPFTKEKEVRLFDGSFTWHWHNRWDQEVEEGSKFQILESKINREFETLIR
jgi:hypothetical protein